MRAAVVTSFDRSPIYGEASKPEPADNEVLIRVCAAPLSNLVRAQSSGTHYSSTKVLPFTPGNDGVGLTSDSRRVYFFSPRQPFGSMAEFTVVDSSLTIELPDALDDVTAAALGNPGLATWGALLNRARLVEGEVVFVNGATGVTGRHAIQVAKLLGASRVIAAGRNEGALAELLLLGADEVISLSQPPEDLSRELRRVFRENKVNVVLDYLWGTSAETILQALAGQGDANGEHRVRFVQIGSISGGIIPINAHLLRSSGIELLGSGLGSLSSADIISALRTMYAMTTRIHLEVVAEAVPLSEVEDAWLTNTGGRRLVFIP